ncbi:hypothetical protein [Clavibacter californiensis]|jgi:hypothetical protein|uniref:Lipoprotein n=1 Tax=Clavibacter californiensis TaxID=1401995 RepID=A0ABX9N4E2_9MICO|nr:hypothetical protein [Clavibacter californiensis]PPF55094.1 hypothetical protein C5C13_12735 [Clavibacter michiganensis]RII91357.1 hypothetical protein DZF98_09730 [Clavibacter californiensis]UKF81181.1 hypothetical protein FGD68_05880 [Clavibacter californiensis]
MHRPTLTVLAAVASAALLSGCGASAQFTSPTTEIYATTADAQTALGTAMPTWIPADGTLIRTKSEAKAGSIVAVQTATPAPAPGGCTDLQMTTIQDTWWPPEIDPATVTCADGWNVFGANGRIYGWSTTVLP